MSGFLSRLIGASQPRSVELGIFDIQTDTAKEMEMTTTVCLMPRIVNGERVEFHTHPDLKNAGGSRGWNLLGHLRNSLRLDEGQRIVISRVTRLNAVNELPGEFNFYLEHVFDDDPDTQKIRAEVDKAVSITNASDTVHVRTRISRPKQRPLPPEAPPKPKNDIMALYGDTLPLEKGKQEDSALSVDDEFVELDALCDKPAPQETAEDVFSRADKIGFRSAHVHRNRAEIDNRIGLGELAASRADPAEMILYTASVAKQTVKWFAGQEESIMHDPAREFTEVNKDLGGRDADFLATYTVFPAEHTLIMFIRMFRSELEVKDDEMEEMGGDRDTNKRWFKVKKTLVDRARQMTLYVTYAQIYYTTLADCRLVRHTNPEDDDAGLIKKIVAHWKLRMDPVTDRITDWPQGEYRPMIVLTLKIEYFLISKMRNSAASLHKIVTRLQPK